MANACAQPLPGTSCLGEIGGGMGECVVGSPDWRLKQPHTSPSDDIWREDGRTSSLDMRPIRAEFGGLARADGSCELVQGSTRVLAGVFGPSEPPQQRRAVLDRAYLQVVFRHRGAPSVSLRTRREMKPPPLPNFAETHEPMKRTTTSPSRASDQGFHSTRPVIDDQSMCSSINCSSSCSVGCGKCSCDTLSVFDVNHSTFCSVASGGGCSSFLCSSERSMEYALFRFLSSLVDLRRFPLARLLVVVQVVSDDGGVLPTAANAAVMALAQAAVPLRHVAFAVAMAWKTTPLGNAINEKQHLVRTKPATPAQPKHCNADKHSPAGTTRVDLVLDPIATEEARSDGVQVMAIDIHSGRHSNQQMTNLTRVLSSRNAARKQGGHCSQRS
eukprot:GHVT01034150.1.p1 GENE.GHVT01034150.1~~GHVT01034150.1.p1  ORF type:complete len:386 (-),score=45.32 GHVT01034150.1:2873-4030(-)